MKKLFFSFLILFPSFVLPRNPFHVNKKEIKQGLPQESFELNGIVESDGKFAAVISSGISSSIVFVGDNFQSYKVSLIGNDHIILNSLNENKKLNLTLKS